MEQKIIEEYIYEDEDDEDYENENLTDFSEGIELTGTKIEHDEGKRLTNNVFITIQNGKNSTRKWKNELYISVERAKCVAKFKT